MPVISSNGPVWTLDLGADENRFTPDWMEQLHAGLDEVLASPDPAVLLTRGTGKFFSNGLDLDWLGAHPEELGSYVDRIHAMFSRLLTLPVPTVAAVNGHAFGGGAMLAMCHDFRVMRQDRGYWCLPESDINIPFTPGMNALLLAKLTPRSQVLAMTTGHRFGGPEALAREIVDATAGEADVLATATGIVEPLAGKDRATLGTIKETLYAAAVEALARPQG